MKKNLNHPEIARYARQFASIVCQRFFGQHTAITGKQMVELCENRQINLFAIKTIYYQWQAETSKIKSPYFDFGNPEVAKALTALMNVLSRNISVGRADFEPVLAMAVADTISLALSPQEFYTNEFSDIESSTDVAVQVKPLAKYYVINRSLFDAIVAQLERQGSHTSPEKAVQAVAVVCGQAPPQEDAAQLLASLGKVLPFDIQRFWEQEETVEEDPLDFGGNGSSELASTSFDITKFSFGLEAPAEEAPVYVPPVQAETPVYVPPVQKETPAEEGAKVVSLNERFAQAEEPSSLNERFGKQEQPATVSDMFKNQKVESLKNFIPLNRKFAFINELFNGSSQEFNEAVEMIDQCADYHKAIMLIKERYFRKNNWDLEKDEVKEFYEMVSSKF